jgi:hypothetical protein
MGVDGCEIDVGRRLMEVDGYVRMCTDVYGCGRMWMGVDVGGCIEV